MAPFHWPWTAPQHPHPRATWATLNVTVDAAPQVLTSVEIIPTVS
jgi:hypothetical protein